MVVRSDSHVGIVFHTVVVTFGAEPSLPVSFTLLSFVYVHAYVCACSFIGVCTGTRVCSHMCSQACGGQKLTVGAFTKLSLPHF